MFSNSIQSVPGDSTPPEHRSILVDPGRLELDPEALDSLARGLAAEEVASTVSALTELLGGEPEAILLYGSRSRDEQHEFSDFDLLVVCQGASPQPEGLRWRWAGLDLDLDVAGGSFWEEALEGRMYLRGGRVWWDPQGRLQSWLTDLERRWQEGPPPMSWGRRYRMASWLGRMQRRLPSPLREAQLLSALPELVLEDQGRWPMGPSQCEAWLASHWPELWQSIQGGRLKEAAELVRLSLLQGPGVLQRKGSPT